MNETWKDVIGYEGLYQVSDLGRVRSLKYKKVQVLMPRFNNRGHLTVRLYLNGKGRNVYIHRLVAEAFIPNPSVFPVVNHKDENPVNNAARNLEWCTQKYNVNYGTCTARMAAKHLKVVLQYDKSGNLVKEWPSAKEVERQMGFARSNISTCCLGKRRYAYGYVWKFK